MKSKVRNSTSQNWPRVKLGELCNLVNGDAYRETDWSIEGVPIIRIQNLNNPDKPFNYWSGSLDGRVIVKPGDVLLAWSGTPGTSFGTHRWTRGIGILNQHIFRVDLDTARIDPEWVVFSINEQLQEMIGRAHGAVGLRHVTKGECESLPILLPPLPEQRRLAARLREQMAEVERSRAAVQAQLDAAQSLPAALLRAIFTSPTAQRWPRRRLGDVLETRNDIIHPRNKPTGTATFVGLEHIEPNTGRQIGSIEIDKAEMTGRKAQFFKGDIVYGYLRPYLNKVWIAEFDGLCSVDQYVYQVNSELAVTPFVAWFMRSSTYLERAPIGGSPGQLPRIRMDEVAATEINLPPRAEQKKIAARLDAELTAARTLTETLETRLAEIELLPAALLRQAFNPAN